MLQCTDTALLLVNQHMLLVLAQGATAGVVSPLESSGLFPCISSLTVSLNVITSNNMCFACMT